MQVIDILKASLRQIGQLAPGRSPNQSETADALSVLNRMLDAWNTESLAIYSRRVDQYTLVPSQQSYTIGTGGDFDAARPVRITTANLIITTNPAQPLRHPLEILVDETQWGRIKLQAVATSIPLKLYNDRAHPLSTLYFWPVPTVAYPIELYTWRQIARFASATDAVDFPPGYEEAVVCNLALRLCPEWGKLPRADVADLARTAKAAIQSLNSFSSPVMACDPVLAGTRSSFNWLMGE